MLTAQIRNIARSAAILTAGAALVCSTGCSNAGEGVLSGAAIGAGGGAIIGSMLGHAGTGAAIGAVGGAVTGGVIGDQNQRNDYRHRDW